MLSGPVVSAKFCSIDIRYFPTGLQYFALLRFQLVLAGLSLSLSQSPCASLSFPHIHTDRNAHMCTYKCPTLSTEYKGLTEC